MANGQLFFWRNVLEEIRYIEELEGHVVRQGSM